MNYDINEFLPIRQGECKNAWEEIEKKGESNGYKFSSKNEKV